MISKDSRIDIYLSLLLGQKVGNDVHGYWKDDGRVLLRRNGVQGLQVAKLKKEEEYSVWKSREKVALRAKRATFTFWVDKRFIKNAKKSSILAEACGQTVLPDRLLLKGQKLVENAEIQMRYFE